MRALQILTLLLITGAIGSSGCSKEGDQAEDVSAAMQADGEVSPNSDSAETKTDGAVVGKRGQNLTIDGVSALAVLVIASFAIDRVVTGLLFVLVFIGHWVRILPDPELIEDEDDEYVNAGDEELPKPSAKVRRLKAERTQKLLYYVLAGLLGGVVLAWFGNVRIFEALGFKAINPILDSVMTGLILIAGADRVAALLRLPGAGVAERPEHRAVKITGELIMKDGASARDSS